jgi:hypothetical protein
MADNPISTAVRPEALLCSDSPTPTIATGAAKSSNSVDLPQSGEGDVTGFSSLPP